MKSIFFGAAFKLLIATAIAVVLVNDIGSLASTRYALDKRAKEIGNRTIQYYNISGSPSRARVEAEALALQNDTFITNFKIVNKHILKFTIEIPNRKTWIAHRIEALKPYFITRMDYSREINR